MPRSTVEQGHSGIVSVLLADGRADSTADNHSAIEEAIIPIVNNDAPVRLAIENGHEHVASMLLKHYGSKASRSI